MRQEVIQKAPEQAKKQTPNLTGIPTQMKLDFERRSGLSFDDVRVHYNSDKPRRIGALAYTQIPQVHIGPGQERHLQHELGHVVQQKRGIVRPTGIEHGMAINRSPVLEHSADLGTVPQFVGSAVVPVVQCSEAEPKNLGTTTKTVLEWGTHPLVQWDSANQGDAPQEMEVAERHMEPVAHDVLTHASGGPATTTSPSLPGLGIELETSQPIFEFIDYLPGAIIGPPCEATWKGLEIPTQQHGTVPGQTGWKLTTDTTIWSIQKELGAIAKIVDVLITQARTQPREKAGVSPNYNSVKDYLKRLQPVFRAFQEDDTIKSLVALYTALEDVTISDTEREKKIDKEREILSARSGVLRFTAEIIIDGRQLKLGSSSKDNLITICKHIYGQLMGIKDNGQYENGIAKLKVLHPFTKYLVFSIQVTAPMALEEIYNMYLEAKEQPLKNPLLSHLSSTHAELFTRIADSFSSAGKLQPGKAESVPDEEMEVGVPEEVVGEDKGDIDKAGIVFCLFLKQIFSHETDADPKQKMPIMPRTSLGKIFSMLSKDTRQKILVFFNSKFNEPIMMNRIAEKSPILLRNYIQYLTELNNLLNSGKENPNIYRDMIIEKLDNDPIASHEEELGIGKLKSRTETDLGEETQKKELPIFEFRNIGGTVLSNIKDVLVALHDAVYSRLRKVNRERKVLL